MTAMRARPVGGPPRGMAAELPELVIASPDAVAVLDRRLVVLVVNPAASDLAGVAARDLVGHSACDLLSTDDAWALQRGAATALAGDDVVTVTHRLRRPDEREIWLESRLRRLPGPSGDASRLLAVARDVTDRVRADRHLAAAAATWSDLWQLMREGVIVIDRAGMVLTANDAAAKFLGLDLDQLHGSLARAHVTVIGSDGRPVAAAHLPSTRAFRTGTTQTESIGYRRRDGSVVWLSARVVPLWRPGAAEPDRVAIMLENAVGPAVDDGDVSRPHTGSFAEAARTVLTPRELDVLRMLANGDDVRAVAVTLGISIHTARGHVKSLMRKLDARTQLQAVVLALRAGLLEID